MKIIKGSKKTTQFDFYSFLKSKTSSNLLIVTAIAFIIYLAFYNYFEKLYSKYIINNLLQFFTPSPILEIIYYIGILLFIIIIVIRITNNFQMTINSWVLSLVIASIYERERFNSEFIFNKLSSLININYADLVFLFPIYTTILLFSNLIQHIFKVKNINKGFLADRPLEGTGIDLYNRENYAKNLAKKIENTFTDESLAIGINGVWGTGKTSFINLIKKNLNKEKTIIIDFNPWDSLNKENIVSRFFAIIENKTKKYSRNLSKEVLRYADSLANRSGNTFIKLIKEMFRYYFYVTSVQSFNEVNDILKGINKKIIVFIDDIDRLQKDEIIQVIKLIRNTANFYNTIFIVPFDKNYIIEALKEINEVNSIYFIEKIFQIEIDLPYIDSYVLRKELVNKLRSGVNNKFYDEINQLISPNTSLAFPTLDLFIETMRDVTRFANLFLFQFPLIQDEVVFSDYFNLCLIKLKYPFVISLLYNEQNEIFEETTLSKDRQLQLIYDKEPKSILFKKLSANVNNKISPNKIKTIENTICALFPNIEINRHLNKDEPIDNYFLYRERGKKSIVNPTTFYRYFANMIFSFDISEIEWKNILTQDYQVIIKKFKEWVNKGARQEIYRRIKLSNIYTYANKEQFEYILTAIFELSKYKVETDISEYDCQFDHKVLIQMIYDGKLIAETYYKNELPIYIDYLKKLFHSDDSPFNYCVGLIYLIANNQNYYDGFPIKRDELIEINVEYLRRYINVISELDRTAWDLFYDCKYNHDKIVDSAKAEMKKYFKRKGINYFINSAAIVKNEGASTYSISAGVWAVFDQESKMLEFLNEFDETPLVKEFKEFYKVAIQNDVKRNIKYDFKEIKINLNK